MKPEFAEISYDGPRKARIYARYLISSKPPMQTRGMQ